MSTVRPPPDLEIDPVHLHDLTDLPAALSLTPDDYLRILRGRTLSGLIYTQVSPRVLISVNPHHETQVTSDSALVEWTVEHGDCGQDELRGRLEPHVWSTSSKAYYYMRRTGQDQTIILSGETASGKTETARLLLKHFIDLSVPPPGKKISKLAQQLPAAFFILSAFGTSSTVPNASASRFGRYSELQFNEKGRLVGLKGLEYGLEKSRVTSARAGERNFDVFYWLMSGATGDEREHLKLGEASSSPYLFNSGQHGRTGANNHGDSNQFNTLKEAFKAIGFPKKAVASICQLLSAILHLGLIEFHFDRQRSTDSVVVKNVKVLEVVAEFLGVDQSDLESALINKSVLIDGVMASVFLDAEGASQNRDDLAKALYGLIFSWIGEFLNQKLCKEDFTTFIALVDFPGPSQQSSGGSSRGSEAGIDAFCVNLASERLFGLQQEELFERKKLEYIKEGVSASLEGLEVGYRSNKEFLRVLTNVPGGLVHIVDDQSKRKGKTDGTMLKAMTKRWGNHSDFASRDGDDALGRPGTFTCSHWDGSITYSVENFLADNSSALSPTFVSLLGGTTPSVGLDGQTTPAARDLLSTGGSSLSFVRQLFSSGAVETTSHPKSEEVVVTANQKVGPRRAPSTRRQKGQGRGSGTVAGVEEEEATLVPKDSSGRSVVQDFNESLTLLLSTISETTSWYIFCMRPNDSQLPNQVDGRVLKQQIRAFGLPELTRRLRGEWEVNLDQKEWWERYGSVAGLAEEKTRLANLVWKDKVAAAREIWGWTEKDIAVGSSKVFLSDSAFRILEDYLRVSDVDEQQRKAEKSNRDPHSTVIPDPYSPYATPVSRAQQQQNLGGGLQGYNSNFAQTSSTAALPLVNRKAGGELTPGLAYDDDDFDRKTFYTEGGDDDYFIGGSQAGTPRGAHHFDLEEGTGSVAPSGYAPSRPMLGQGGLGEKDLRKGEMGVEGQVTEEEVRMTPTRRRWVALTWLFTWWIPSFVLSWCGGMKRRDVRMAWREKLLINMLIWFLCACAVFVIVFLGNIICPKEYVYSPGELASASYNGDPGNMLVAIRGEIFDLTGFASVHQPGNAVIPLRSIQKYGGLDATNIFPVQVSALCNGVDGTVSPWVTLDSANSTNTVAKYHDFRASTTDSRPDWYFETMIYLRYNFRKGFVGYTPGTVSSKAKAGTVWAIYDGGIYDLTSFVTNNGGGYQVPDGTSAPADIDTARYFMSQQVVSLFQRRAGHDITNDLNNLGLDPDVLQRQKICLRNLFFVGKTDNRNSPQCLFARYILEAISIVLVAVIGFKFLAALQFGRGRKPEDYDKFVICQVPCYTEGEESLRNCIDSLTKLKYDDKRKLLFIICDGMIVGSGNDRPTPRIVLDILGADPTLDPEPLSFLSIGDGTKQHNMAKIYSGLHEAAGHIVPYIVVVKVGKPTERSRPGNRGKRDSQMLLMRFLNRVHFDSPMAPAELEMYHQIKNVIGVNPSFYEYLLMVDADTVVDPYSLNHLVGSFVQDKKVVGLCGETSLSNAKASWTTMMQVYEYWISHYLSKAFESLFGSVTCLPGCFSIYRIRSVEHKPLIIANNIIKEYGINRVDTLHVKNLLSLGEDRYLTTVMMKEFPEYKTKFYSAAKAQTIAPDDWKVLASQRRRWINSTIHNLAELLFVDRMCGFCCFSMRFIVMIDLASTLVAPVTVAYIFYLIYTVAAEHKTIPTTALIMLCAIYGLQALIFILHRKFEMIGWMVVYILAIPLFSFVLPLVSFWQMDNFSWGSTREIVGEKGKRVIVHDEGKFDPSSIPLKSWQDFENELWEAGSNHSIGSLIAASKREDNDSRYGQESMYQGPYPNTGSGGKSPAGSRSFVAEPPGHMSRPSYAGSYNTLAPPMDASVLGPSGYFDRGLGSGSNLELASRPVSYAATNQYPSSTNRAPTPLRTTSPGAFLPSDEQIVSDVHQILANADLQTLTKKGCREELERMYGVELGEKKALVNRVISEALGL